uniref:PmbA_TldD domain-containing protein n=1 Tax=Parastrongyloides trichosuri TaxID=131310 RepID=A0A0N5A108_PARTI
MPKREARREAMRDTIDVQLKKGVLGLCVLALLARRDSYAYEIASRLSDAIGMGEGTIYPLMRRRGRRPALASGAVGLVRRRGRVRHPGSGRHRHPDPAADRPARLRHSAVAAARRGRRLHRRRLRHGGGRLHRPAGRGAGRRAAGRGPDGSGHLHGRNHGPADQMADRRHRLVRPPALPRRQTRPGTPGLKPETDAGPDPHRRVRRARSGPHRRRQCRRLRRQRRPPRRTDRRGRQGPGQRLGRRPRRPQRQGRGRCLGQRRGPPDPPPRRTAPVGQRHGRRETGLTNAPPLPAGEGLSLQEPKAIGTGERVRGLSRPSAQAVARTHQPRTLTLSRQNDRSALVRSSPLPTGEGFRFPRDASPLNPYLASMSTVASPSPILDAAGVAPDEALSILQTALSGADDGELFLEKTESESLVFDDGRLKGASYDAVEGFGLRVVAGETAGYAHANEISSAAIRRAADSAALAKRGYDGTAAEAPRDTNQRLYDPVDPLLAPAFSDKIALLAEIDAWARARDPRVVQVSASLVGERRAIDILRGDGRLLSDLRPGGRGPASGPGQSGGRRLPGGRDGRGAGRGLARRPAARSRGARLRGRLPPQGFVGLYRHDGQAGRRAGRDGRGRRLNRRASRLPVVRRRRHPDLAHRADRGRDHGRPDARPAVGASAGRERHRQRPPPVLRPHAHAAHDQHLHGRRQGQPGGHDRQHKARPLRRQLRRRSGGHHQRQVRLPVHRGLSDRGRQDHRPGARRHPDRRRRHGPDPDPHDRRRLRLRPRRRHLRQGRSGRPRRHRPAKPQDRRPDSRRHGGLGGAPV